MSDLRDSSLRRRHFRLLAATIQRHDLHEQNLEAFGRAAERDQGRTQPRNVAVMIGAPDINEVLEAALELV